MVTLASLGPNVVVSRPEGVGLYVYTTNGTTILPGTLVTTAGQSTPDVAPVDAGTEYPLGVAVRNADENETQPDVAFGDGERIAVAMCGSGMICWVLAVTSRGALTPGYFVTHGGDRMIEKVLTLSAQSATSWYNQWPRIIGRVVEYDADVADWDYVKVLLCH